MQLSQYVVLESFANDSNRIEKVQPMKNIILNLILVSASELQFYGKSEHIYLRKTFKTFQCFENHLTKAQHAHILIHRNRVITASLCVGFDKILSLFVVIVKLLPDRIKDSSQMSTKVYTFF